MQASLEAETRAKTDALRAKKKLESDINELEIAADNANRARADCEKNAKRLQASGDREDPSFLLAKNTLMHYGALDKI